MTGRVMVESPPYPMAVVEEMLEPLAVRIERSAAPWSGDDVVALLIWERVMREDIDRLPALRVIATCSVGYDHIDLDAARERGVWVCNVPDYCIDEMAESTLALIVSLLRGVVALDRTVRDGRWDDHAAGVLARVAGTRLGVIGFGRIGRAVARLAKAIGMDVVACDPVVTPAEMVAAGVQPAELDELLESCGVVTLHVPLTGATATLIDARGLARMPPGAFLVNTARAGLVDQDAMLAALDSGALGGAAIDVLAVEPPTPAHPAPVHPRLIVTPHSAWYSERAEREVFRRAVIAVRDVLEGREPSGAVVRGR